MGMWRPVSAAGTAGHVRVLPSKVAIRGHATVVASQLKPRATITLLLAVPDLSSHRFERLLGATHADARGNLRVRVTVPIVTTCGPAAIYLIPVAPAQPVHAGLTLTGCTAKSKGAPPAPPKP